jgi:hypothetical protein
MAEETKTLRHTAEEIDNAIDKLPSNGNAAGIYKSSLSFSSIVNDGNVTQDQLTEINSIYAAWKSGRMVYVLDEKGGYYNLGVLNMQLAEDNSKCSFVALNQDGVLCYYSCNPSSGVTGKWSVTPIGKDLFALIEHTHKASDVTEETNKHFVTDEEKDELSTLSTVYAKADLSNAMTVSLGQNGYAKFNNGLLIQWGYSSGTSSAAQTVYMPTSFYDTNYIAIGSVIKNNADNNAYTFCPIYGYSINSFKVDRNFVSTSTGVSSAKFNWIAIGRWK